VTLSLVMQTCLGTSAEGISNCTCAAPVIADIHTNNLNLDINLDETFAEWVDLDETGINRAIKSTELGDQTDVTLRDRFVGVRADNTTRNGAHGSNT
jgi:hypothetical protein